VGPGGSQEAEYSLQASVPAGAYHVICDAIIIRDIDVTFALVHRRAGIDTTLATWDQSFAPLANGMYTAQAYELSVEAPAIEYQPGDQLIFRYSGANSTAMMAFIPNGDGHITGGRIPNITLPR
jgi:FtsP/CotA-like multicopper oxidase with cupredoxin domain